MASEYSWTLEQIFKLTFREVDYLLKQITKRRNLDYKFQASIHGVEIRIPEEAEKVEVDEDMQATMDKAIEQQKQKKAKQHGRISSKH